MATTRRRCAAVLFVLGLLLAICTSGWASPVKLTIVHVNDVHGYLLPFDFQGELRGGMPQIMTVIEEIEASSPNMLFLAGGDMIAGANDAYMRDHVAGGYWGFRGVLDFRVMNRMGFDAMVLGNHEFDYGKRWLTRLLEEADFAVLSANAVHQDIPSVTGRDGELLVPPYEIFSVGGLRVAVIGLSTGSSLRTRQVKVLNAKETLMNLLPEIEADLVVVLSHLGLSGDQKLAGELPLGAVDVIVGGHSHSLTEEALFEGETIIVQSGKWGMNVGVLDLLVEDGDVVEWSFRVIPIDERIPAHEGIAAYIESQLVLGEVAGGTFWSSREQPSSLGRLTTDAMVWLTDADAALAMSHLTLGIWDEGPLSTVDFFETFWPYRSGVNGPQKDLDEQQLISLVERSPDRPLWSLVFNSDRLESIVLLELTGSEIAQLLADNDQRNGTDYYLQYSGDVLVGGDLDADRIYRVAVNLTLALETRYGLFEKRDSFEFLETEVFEAAMEYIKQHGVVTPHDL
jgi:5'-nucleotidase/UDP-sugar diphosphatase